MGIKIDKKKLTAAIDAKGFTLYQFLDILDMSLATYYRWLREGFPALAVLGLCQALDVEEEAIKE